MTGFISSLAMDVEQEADDPETMILQKCLLSNPINNLIPINYTHKKNRKKSHHKRVENKEFSSRCFSWKFTFPTRQACPLAQPRRMTFSISN